MNKVPPKGAALERALRTQLLELLRDTVSPTGIEVVVPEPPQPTGADFHVRSSLPAELQVHCKSSMRPQLFPAWAKQYQPRANARAVPVLAMPSVSPRLAELCQQARWGWYDLSGNCVINFRGLLHVERTGNPPVYRAPRPTANLGTAAAARVLRVLLSPAHAETRWTQRELQERCSWGIEDQPRISLGLVNKVVRHLREEGFVEEADRRGVRVRDPIGLLDAWRDAYRFDRHERHGYFTLLKKPELDEALDEAASEAGRLLVYAAFSAAERQAPQVRQNKTWLYVAAELVDALARRVQAKEVDSGDNIVVLIPEDPGVFSSFAESSRAGNRQLACTDPVQTYVDLWHCGGRGEEAAEAVLEQRILPAWKAAGIA